jgi:hypothetical protein
MEPSPISSAIEVHLCIDIFYVDGETYLLSVVKPFNALIVTHISTRSAANIKKAITAHASKIASYGKTIVTIYTDGEGGLKPLIDWLGALKIRLNVTAAGEHVPEVERAIRELKERCRAILSTLPFKLPRALMPWLINYVVSRINLTPSSIMNHHICPRELLTGVRPDFHRDLRASFGEYVETKEPDPQPASLKSNVRIPRTEAAIALLPIGNEAGSVKFFCLSKKSFVTRDRWIPLPMTNNCIEFLNNMASLDAKPVSNDPTFKMGIQIIDSLEADDQVDEDEDLSPLLDKAEETHQDLIDISSADAIPAGNVISHVPANSDPMLQTHSDAPAHGGVELLVDPLDPPSLVLNAPSSTPTPLPIDPIIQLTPVKQAPQRSVRATTLMEPVVVYSPPVSNTRRTSRKPWTSLSDSLAKASAHKEILMLRVFRARQACYRQSRRALDAKSDPHKSNRERHEYGLHFTVKKAVAKFGKAALKSIVFNFLIRKCFTPSM